MACMQDDPGVRARAAARRRWEGAWLLARTLAAACRLPARLLGERNGRVAQLTQRPVLN
jgi:hypothetical protein